MKIVEGATVYLPDERDVKIARYGMGNRKLGASVFTFSRTPGANVYLGTCPGETTWCSDRCYAKRIEGPVREVHRLNSGTAEVSPIPAAAKLLRIHVSGDFDTIPYINAWRERLLERPDVRAWAYTRSFRVPKLVPALEQLRALPNLQLFASMDPSTTEPPPPGWRVAWIAGDPRLSALGDDPRLQRALAGHTSYACPEQTGEKTDCASCRYCLDGFKNTADVTFSEH